MGKAEESRKKETDGGDVCLVNQLGEGMNSHELKYLSRTVFPLLKKSLRSFLTKAH